MDTIEKSPQAAAPGSCAESEHADAEADFKPLAAHEAAVWRQSQVNLSVWRVIGWQWLAVLVVGALAWWWGGRATGWSAAYGGVSIALPSTLMAWGVTVGRLSRLLSAFAQGSLAALVFWEGVKVVLCMALLSLAIVVVPNLNWLALVVGLVFVLKVYWLAFLMLSRAAR
jgi:ATP synthase protein I